MNKKFDVLCFGEILIDFVAQQNSSCLKSVNSFLKAAGGAPANVAVGIAKLGGCVSFAGRVGNDPMGLFLADTLHKYNINTAALQIDPAASTPLAFVTVSEEGERDFCFFRHHSADLRLDFDETTKRAIEASRLFHFGSFTMSSFDSRRSTTQALDYAKVAGTLVSFDPNIRLNVWSDEETCRNVVLTVMPKADIVKVSDEEARFLTQSNSLQGATKRLIDMGPKIVVVTKGRDGSCIATREDFIEIGNFPHAPVDTTGAGDGFWAAFLYTFSRCVEPQKLGRTIPAHMLYRMGLFANAVGTLTTQSRGAIPSLPDIQQVDTFLLEALARVEQTGLRASYTELREFLGDSVAVT